MYDLKLMKMKITYVNENSVSIILHYNNYDIFIIKKIYKTINKKNRKKVKYWLFNYLILIVKIIYFDLKYEVCE